MRGLRSRDTLKDRASIHDRPDAINCRVETGYGEGDLILCKRARPVLVLHERRSQLTLAAPADWQNRRRDRRGHDERLSPARSGAAQVDHLRQ